MALTTVVTGSRLLPLKLDKMYQMYSHFKSNLIQVRILICHLMNEIENLFVAYDVGIKLKEDYQVNLCCCHKMIKAICHKCTTPTAQLPTCWRDAPPLLFIFSCIKWYYFYGQSYAVIIFTGLHSSSSSSPIREWEEDSTYSPTQQR